MAPTPTAVSIIYDTIQAEIHRVELGPGCTESHRDQERRIDHIRQLKDMEGLFYRAHCQLSGKTDVSKAKVCELTLDHGFIQGNTSDGPLTVLLHDQTTENARELQLLNEEDAGDLSEEGADGMCPLLGKVKTTFTKVKNTGLANYKQGLSAIQDRVQKITLKVNPATYSERGSSFVCSLGA